MLVPSKNRQYFHEFALPNFIKILPSAARVIDLGKSQSWGDYYRELFKNFTYLTVDIQEKVNPDICENFEETKIYPETIDGVIAMGIWEQTPNPFKLVESIEKVLRPGGILLAGITSVGYPVYSTDLTRFTPKGGLNLLKNFTILESETIMVDDVPEYLFYIARKNGK